MIANPWILMTLGAIVGIAVGLTGIGGGSLMTPLLLFLGVPIPTAIGTDLCYAAVTKFSGMIAHHKKRNVNWRLVLSLAAGSLPGVGFAIALLRYTSEYKTLYTEILTYSMGWMLVITSISILFHGHFKKLTKYYCFHEEHNERNSFFTYMSCLLTGCLIGIFVTLSSVGAGAIGTAALLILFPSMLPMRVIGTEIAHAVPLTVIASIGHLYLGNVDFHLLMYLIMGSIPGIVISAYLINKLPVKLLRYILAGLLLIFGCNYIFV